MNAEVNFALNGIAGSVCNYNKDSLPVIVLLLQLRDSASLRNLKIRKAVQFFNKSANRIVTQRIPNKINVDVLCRSARTA